MRRSKWAPGETRECRFVFIGKHLDKDALLAGFDKCRCDLETRFKPGDKVLAKVGKGADGFFPGVILKVWDEGNPYRIELQDDEKTNVWGPVDEAIYVKAA